LVLFLVTLFLSHLTLAADSYTAQVVKVMDGNAILVKRADGGQVKIRLWVVNCPELCNPRAPETRRFTAAVCLGRQVQIIPNDII